MTDTLYTIQAARPATAIGCLIPLRPITVEQYEQLFRPTSTHFTESEILTIERLSRARTEDPNKVKIQHEGIFIGYVVGDGVTFQPTDRWGTWTGLPERSTARAALALSKRMIQR